MSINYEIIPEHCRPAMQLYIDNGIPPGGFLNAVLCNDFCAAVVRADDINSERLRDYAVFLYCEAPRECSGSPELVNAWIERGGLNAASKGQP